jgi:hydrogenase nickel incorporation protein HypA/HybF
MHDKVFAKEIKNIVTKKLDSLERPVRINAIHVRLSPLSHVKPETLREAFFLEVNGSKLEGIPLKINLAKIGIKCGSCGKEFLVANPIFSCPACEGQNLQLKQGPEFFVESIEIEK